MDLSTLEALAVDTSDLITRLSPDSRVLIWAAIDWLLARKTWEGSDLNGHPDDDEWDLLQEKIDRLVKETMTNFCIGWVIPITTALPTGVLECDGTTYLKADYPELAAVIDSAFNVDSTHFKVPDLRGHTVIGLGHDQYSRYTYTMDYQVGVETVTLDINQIPVHDHGERVWNDVPAFVWNGSTGTNMPIIQSASKTANTARLKTDSAGGGSLHENMQPSRALRYGIVAK